MPLPSNECHVKWPENTRLHEDSTYGLLTLDAEINRQFCLKYEGFEAHLLPPDEIHIDSTGSIPTQYFIERLATPFLRLLNGHILLHASALSTPQGGIVLLAPSGIGKSTMAASLLSFPDVRLIADDIATISSGKIYPISSQLAMRHDMADREDYVESIEFNGYKRLLNIRQNKVAHDPTPLSCICILESGTYSAPRYLPFSECISQILAQQLKLSNPPYGNCVICNGTRPILPSSSARYISAANTWFGPIPSPININTYFACAAESNAISAKEKRIDKRFMIF